MKLGIILAVLATAAGLWLLASGFQSTTPVQADAPAEKAVPAAVVHHEKPGPYDSLIDHCRVVFARLADKPVSSFTMPDLDEWNDCEHTMAQIEDLRLWDAANPGTTRALKHK